MQTLSKEDTFCLAVERYADMLYRIAIHAAPRREDAEDAVQDTYEKLLAHAPAFASEQHLKAWLIRVTINRCHDLCRASARKSVPLDDAMPAAPDARDGRLLAAIRALPEKQRCVIYLHYYEGYTAAEIGAMLDAPANTVLTWLSRGRGRLKELLKEEIEDEVV